MDDMGLCKSSFPLCNIQTAYYVGEQGHLASSTRPRWYRELIINNVSEKEIEKAWNLLVRRHAMLRSVVSLDGEQVILKEVPEINFHIDDFSSLSDDEKNARSAAIRNELLELEISPEQWPQFSVRVVKNGFSISLHLRFNLWMLDATSEQILYSELNALCQYPHQGLPALDGEFRQFVSSIAEEKETSNWEDAKKYWQNRLDTLPMGPTLPYKIAPDAVASPQFGHLKHRINRDKWNRFIANAEKVGVTANSAVLAAYALTLATWSREQRFTITVLVSLRHAVDVELSNVIGNFGTTMLLELNLSEVTSFAALCKRVQKQLWTDMRSLKYSALELSHDINARRGMPGSLVAPVTFTTMQSNIQHYDESAALSDYNEDEPQPLVHLSDETVLCVPQVMLDHQLMEGLDCGTVISWDYVENAFFKDVVEEMFQAYTNFINRLLLEESCWQAQPKLPISYQQQRLLNNYNETAAPCAPYGLHEPILQQAYLRGEKVAIVNGNERITFSSLKQRSDQLTSQLAAAKVNPGSMVGVVLKKGWQQIVAVMSISRVGAVYVPLDPDLPSARISQIIEQANIQHIIGLEGTANKSEAFRNITMIKVSDVSPLTPVQPNLPKIDPDSLAYVMFTSGSTGVPKGVAISHSSAANTLTDIANRLSLTAADSIFGLSSLSFDLSVFDMFGILGVGGTLVIPTESEFQSPSSWLELVKKNNITIWNSVPAFFQLFIDTCSEESMQVPSMRHVMMSGDWIPRFLPEKAKNYLPNARIFSLGGATEASIWSIIHEIREVDDSWSTIPYGTPLANQQMYVLNKNLDTCPLWVVGDIYIGGDGLAQCYLHNEERTRTQFITHPITSRRLYWTGDIGRMRPDGNMEFLGREDHQIKLRGFRVELGEIEAVLLEHPGAADALVRVFGKSSDSMRLVAIFIPADKNGSNDTCLSTIKTYLMDRLPRYMVPDQIVAVDEFPLSSNGKIDLKKLESLLQDIESARKVNVNAENTINFCDEFDLSKIWEDVLSISDVDPGRSFFELGGTSFNLLRLVSKVRAHTDCDLSLNDVSPQVSLASLTDLVGKKKNETTNTGPSLLHLNEVIDKRKISVVFIHPVGGSIHCYLPIAKGLGDRARAVGIQAGKHHPGSSTSIEEMAAKYTALLLEAIPARGYILVGWSMGASVAVEMTRLLKKKNIYIHNTILIDPYCTENSSASLVERNLLISFVIDMLGVRAREDVIDLENTIGLIIDTMENPCFENIMIALIKQGMLTEILPIGELEEIYNIFVTNSRALIKYQPAEIDKGITVFIADEPLRGSAHLRRWLPSASGKIEIIHETDHFSIMRSPHAERVSEEILASIREKDVEAVEVNYESA